VIDAGRPLRRPPTPSAITLRSTAAVATSLEGQRTRLPEGEWPELAYKLPPKKPQGCNGTVPNRQSNEIISCGPKADGTYWI
jgi:hypothetical protein